MSVSSTSLITAAETAAKKNNAAAAASAASSSSTSAATTNDALASLGSNANQFLSLLTTQLQNQDPTSPMDSDSFTSELAQFAGVEQQVTTNTNLGQILSLSQDEAVTQGTSLVGKQVAVSGSTLPLQNGQATLTLSPTTAETVGIAITDASGAVVKTQALSVGAGNTNWTWDGKDDEGDAMPDGSYGVAVVTAGVGDATGAVPFTAMGTVTGVSKDATGTVDVRMGTTSVAMGAVSSVS